MPPSPEILVPFLSLHPHCAGRHLTSSRKAKNNVPKSSHFRKQLYLVFKFWLYFGFQKKSESSSALGGQTFLGWERLSWDKSSSVLAHFTKAVTLPFSVVFPHFLHYFTTVSSSLLSRFLKSILLNSFTSVKKVGWSKRTKPAVMENAFLSLSRKKQFSF